MHKSQFYSKGEHFWTVRNAIDQYEVRSIMHAAIAMIPWSICKFHQTQPWAFSWYTITHVHKNLVLCIVPAINKKARHLGQVRELKSILFCRDVRATDALRRADYSLSMARPSISRTASSWHIDTGRFLYQQYCVKKCKSLYLLATKPIEENKTGKNLSIILSIGAYKWNTTKCEKDRKTAITNCDKRYIDSGYR